MITTTTEKIKSMVHILTNKQDQFYWLTVIRKGNTYEVNGESSEYYTQKHNCQKSIANEGRVFYSDSTDIMDHTGKEVVYYELFISEKKHHLGNKLKVNGEDFTISIKEVEFVKGLKK